MQFLDFAAIDLGEVRMQPRRLDVRRAAGSPSAGVSTSQSIKRLTEGTNLHPASWINRIVEGRVQYGLYGLGLAQPALHKCGVVLFAMHKSVSCAPAGPNFLDGYDRLVAFDPETTGKRTPSAHGVDRT